MGGVQAHAGCIQILVLHSPLQIPWFQAQDTILNPAEVAVSPAQFEQKILMIPPDFLKISSFLLLEGFARILSPHIKSNPQESNPDDLENDCFGVLGINTIQEIIFLGIISQGPIPDLI